jgi:hypothetical protein
VSDSGNRQQPQTPIEFQAEIARIVEETRSYKAACWAIERYGLAWPDSVPSLWRRLDRLGFHKGPVR